MKICPVCHFTFEREGEKCMCLPEGKTCEQCYAFKFCKGMGIAKENQKNCDYWPVRFKEKA